MWQCGSFELDTQKPLIMGILNITPDSFSDGGRYFDGKNVNDISGANSKHLNTAYAHARRMIKEGAHIIDIGGESTRPGSEELSVAEELARVSSLVRILADEGCVVSIDTRHATVAAACVEQGASIINDVTGFSDLDMIDVLRQSLAGCVISHMQGEPKTMQEAPYYDDVVEEVEKYLLFRACLLNDYGVARKRIAIDPGPGFGKNFEHNLALLRATGRLASHGYPVMASWSRKRFIGELTERPTGELTGLTAPEERVVGSVTVALYAAHQGARIFRVHDVAATAEALAVFNHIHENNGA